MNNLFGKTLRALMDGAEVKERALAEALDSDQRFYTDSLLDIIGGLDYIEMSILAGSAGLPEILIINDVFCMQLLWNNGGETAAVFSSDREVVAEFARVQGRCRAPGAVSVHRHHLRVHRERPVGRPRQLPHLHGSPDAGGVSGQL